MRFLSANHSQTVRASCGEDTVDREVASGDVHLHEGREHSTGKTYKLFMTMTNVHSGERGLCENSCEHNQQIG
jgi:uncharacterized protein (DUF169 family)